MKLINFYSIPQYKKTNNYNYPEIPDSSIKQVEYMTKEQFEFYQKREELRKKFSSEFMPMLHNDLMARTIFELISRNDDPYRIIEELLKDRIRLTKELQDTIMNNYQSGTIGNNK